MIVKMFDTRFMLQCWWGEGIREISAAFTKCQKSAEPTRFFIISNLKSPRKVVYTYLTWTVDWHLLRHKLALSKNHCRIGVFDKFDAHHRDQKIVLRDVDLVYVVKTQSWLRDGWSKRLCAKYYYVILSYFKRTK